MRKLCLWGLIVLVGIFMSACGGGGGGSSTNTPVTVTGQFVDSFVAGLDYTCSSGDSAITDKNGEFTCKEGDTIEFFLGSYSIGSCSVQDIITPYDLYPNNDEAAINVAQLLQTVDVNGDPSDGISVPENFTLLNSIAILPTSSDFDAQIETAIAQVLVDEETATNHLDGDRNTLQSLLSGKTVYTTINDEVGTLEQWVFNADATAGVWTELVGGSESGSVSVAINGMSMIFTEPDGYQITITVDEITADYLVISGVDVLQDRLYFARTAAEAYFTRFDGTYTSISYGVDDNNNDKTFTHNYTVLMDNVTGSVDILHVNRLTGDRITATIRWNGVLTPQTNNPLIANISGSGTLTYPWIPETRVFTLFSDESLVICDENDTSSCNLYWTSQNPFDLTGLGGEGTLNF